MSDEDKGPPIAYKPPADGYKIPGTCGAFMAMEKNKNGIPIPRYGLSMRGFAVRHLQQSDAYKAASYAEQRKMVADVVKSTPAVSGRYDAVETNHQINGKPAPVVVRFDAAQTPEGLKGAAADKWWSENVVAPREKLTAACGVQVLDHSRKKLTPTPTPPAN